MSGKGILGQKVGMTQIWDEQNRAVPVTVVQAGPCRVVQIKTPERDGYSAVQISFGDIKPKGAFRTSGPLPVEKDEPALNDLHRLVFVFNRRDHGRLRQLINYLNDLPR